MLGIHNRTNTRSHLTRGDGHARSTAPTLDIATEIFLPFLTLREVLRVQVRSENL